MRRLFILLITITQALACDKDKTTQNNSIEDVGSEENQIPQAILAYQTGANSENIDTYMQAFGSEISIVDVNRTIEGRDNVQTWALNEVIPNGSTFKHRKILEQSNGYAKTEVNWITWVVHYSYWWDQDNKITRMSLQYAN